MKYIIDRFEGKFAVLEDDNCKFVNVEKSLIPQNAVEGDVLKKIGEKYIVSKAETKELKEEIDSLCDELFK